jgi:hypothetical protein
MAGYTREDSVIDVLTRLQHQQRMAGVRVTPIPEPPAETEAEAEPEGEVKE